MQLKIIVISDSSFHPAKYNYFGMPSTIRFVLSAIYIRILVIICRVLTFQPRLFNYNKNILYHV